MTVRFETNAVNGRVNLRDTEDLVHHVDERRVGPQVNRLAAKAPRLVEPLRVHVAHDDDGRTHE